MENPGRGNKRCGRNNSYNHPMVRGFKLNSQKRLEKQQTTYRYFYSAGEKVWIVKAVL
jgi:hypothetical protein